MCRAALQADAGEHPKVAAVRASARERLAAQEAGEARAREGLVKNAAGYLEKFYQARASIMILLHVLFPSEPNLVVLQHLLPVCSCTISTN